MVRRTKPVSTTMVQGNNIDIEDLATKVAKAVAKEMAAELAETFKNLPQGRYLYPGGSDRPEDDIQIDERIIPIAIKATEVEMNLQNMAKEEVQVDKDLSKSKSKLAGLLKNRKKKD